jgi:hypothetical protein
MSLPEIQRTEQIWNSLEIAILVIVTLTPVIITFLAFRFNKIIKRLEKQWSNQKITEKRIEIYDRIVPKLNDILCFYCYIGNWKEITPIEIMKLKNELDKDINIYAPLFSDDLITRYNDFNTLCFISFTGWEHDAKIKSLYGHRQEHNVEWKDDWIQCFDTKNVVEPKKMKESYSELMESFKKDLVIFQSEYYPEGNVPKINFN